MADVTSSTSTTTGITGAGGGNMVRITGMASGLDVDALVKKMLTADQLKIDSAGKVTQTVQWKKDAYTSIITGIKDLQTSFFDVTDSSTSVLSDTAYAAFEVTGVNSTAASIVADVGALAGTYAISFTDPLAVTNGNIAKAAGVKSSNPVTTSAAGAPQALNASKLTDLDASITASGSYSMELNYTNSDGVAQNKTISFTGSNTLNDIATKINTATGNSVSARYSDLTGKFSVQSGSTGSNTRLNISVLKSGSVDTTILTALNLYDGTNSTVGTSITTNIATPYSTIGSDTNVWITPPGAATGTLVTKSSNNFSIDGISYNLTAATASSFSVVADSQKVYDKISGFLDKYNALVDQVQTAVTQKKDYDYAPLTTTQQASMSATDIANWNVKAQQGSLSNDANLTKMLSDMRTAFTSAVSSTGLSFGKYGTNSIGLDTSTDTTQGGKITITSKSKLMDAITQHSDQFKKMFTNTSTATDATQKFNEQGIFSRLNDIITNNVGMIGTSYNTSVLTQFANLQDNYSTTGGVGKNTLPDQLYYQQQLVAQLTKNMSADQTKYYNQFTNLETAMNNMSAQMSMISSFSSNVGG